jgi:hypothetical protein
MLPECGDRLFLGRLRGARLLGVRGARIAWAVLWLLTAWNKRLDIPRQ